MKPITESEVEQVCLEILAELGYKIIYGPDIDPDPVVGATGRSSLQKRASYADVILIDRLREAIDRFNPSIPGEAREEAIKQILRNESSNLVINNQRFHKMLVDGVDVEYRGEPGIASAASPSRNIKYDKVAIHILFYPNDAISWLSLMRRTGRR